MTTPSHSGGAPAPDWAKEMRFLDARPPHEVRVELESKIVTLLEPAMDGALLVFRGVWTPSGIAYRLELRLEAALATANCYLLRVEASWAQVSEEYLDYCLKSSAGWFDYWTRNYRAASAPAPGPDAASTERYRALAEQALAAESHLAGVPAIQQEILAAMHRGESFSTAHKEGGTNIRWLSGRYVFADYGESDETRVFKDDASFLAALRQFYDWTVSRNGKPSELDAWKLILRLLRR